MMVFIRKLNDCFVKKGKVGFGCIRKQQVKTRLCRSPPYNICRKANFQLRGLTV